MPSAAQGMETGRVVSWLIGIGDHVERGDPLLEIETPKATVAVEAPATGCLVQIVHGPGHEVPVGEVIAYFETEGSPAR